MFLSKATYNFQTGFHRFVHREETFRGSSGITTAAWPFKTGKFSG